MSMSEFPSLAAVLAEHYSSASKWCSHGRQLCRCGFDLCRPTQMNQSDHQAAVWRETCTITTVEQLAALPPETVIKTEGGSVACRHYDGVHGVVFGDDRPFAWTTSLASELPALLIWHPGWSL